MTLIREGGSVAILCLLVLGTLSLLPSSATATATRNLGLNTQVSSTPVHRTFWLKGFASTNWNGTFPNPGPFMSVVSGDTVTLLLISGDGLFHGWFLDFNNNFVLDSSETSTYSGLFSSTTTYLNFTFPPVIGTNIPSAGNWTYRCVVHPFSMFGTFRVLPTQLSTPVSSASNLDISKVTTTGTLTIDMRALTVSGSLLVTAVNTTGATTFTKNYTIPGLQMSTVPGTTMLVLRFLLNVPVLPYALSSDITLTLQGLTATTSTLLTRQIDINGNGVVDINDFSVASLAYGSSVGSPKYTPLADFDANGTININDISIIALRYLVVDLR